MEIDSEKFERRLLNLKDTQDSITALSKWCLNKRASHKQIVKSWLKTLKEAKIEHRLTLFYLANDVIQHSKRKNYEFVDSWGTSLQRATTLVRDDAKIKEKISRIFNIWEQRQIYTEDFITDLHGLLTINQAKRPVTATATNITPIHSQSASPINPAQRSDDNEDNEEFQLLSMVSSIKNCVSLESETDKHLKLVVKTTIPDIEKVRNNFKDRSHVEEVERDIETAAKKYETFINSISEEIKARKILLTALDQAERFYKNQRKDVKKVVYAYKNFGDRIKSIHSELITKVTNLPSPIPSPDINAPSPEPDDFDLPTEVSYYSSNMNGSFLNAEGSLPFDLNEFYRESPPLADQNQSIQVIQSQDPQKGTAPLNDFYNSLIPSKLEAYNPAAVNFNDSYRQPPLPPTAPPVLAQYTPSPNSQNYLCTAPPPPPPSSSGPPPLPASSLNSSNDEYSWSEWNDTPVSPPLYETKGIEESNIVEYIDENLRDLDSSLNDIDHRQLFGIDTKDVDHRNLISLTGSPGQSHNNISLHPQNGNNEFMQPIMNFPGIGDQNNLGMQLSHRNQRPALLPTPPMVSMRYGRNISMNSESSKGPDEHESSEIDMEMSDDDGSGMDNKNISGDFYNMHPRFPPPHQMNLNRPPPSLPLAPEGEIINQQRKSWIHNNQVSTELSSNDDMDLIDAPPQSLLGIAPPNYLPQNNRFPRGNFRGQNSRGIGKIRGGINNSNGNNSNSPFNNNLRGNNRGAGRGGNFRGRGNFRGGQQW